MSIIHGVGSPGTVGPASGGKVYAYNNIDNTTPIAVAPALASRKRITFHNPGDVDLLIFPQYQQTSGSNAALSVTTSAKGGAFLVYANGATLIIEGECQGAWYALAVSGSGKPITVMDTFV